MRSLRMHTTKKAILFSAIGAAFVAGIVIGLTIVSPGHDTGTAAPKAAEVPVAAPATPATPADTSGEAPADTGEFIPPVPGEGESLYLGQAVYDEADNCLVAFILSADGSEIHDVAIYLENLNLTINQGNTSTQISGVSVTETYQALYPMGSMNTDIDLGKSKINALTLSGDYAYAKLDYVYTHRDFNTGSETDVALGTSMVEFMNMTAIGTLPEDEPAAASEENAYAVSDAASITFEERLYSVSIGVIGTNGDGNTTVEVLSPGIGATIPIRNNQIIVPIQAVIEADDTTIGWDTVNVDTNMLTFAFVTDKMPERIILYPYGGDGDESVQVVFDAESKTILP